MNDPTKLPKWVQATNGDTPMDTKTVHATEAYYQAKIAGLEAQVQRVRRELAKPIFEHDGIELAAAITFALDGERDE